MASLKKKMETDYKGAINIFNPKNEEAVKLTLTMHSKSSINIIGTLCKQLDPFAKPMETDKP